MEKFALIENSIIQATDMKSVNPKLKQPLRNTLKTLVKVSPNQTYSSNAIYNRSFSFEVPRAYNGLAQMYIKCTLSTGSVSSSVDTYFATKIFKRIQLRSRNQTTMQTITPEYSSARVDEAYNTQLYTHLNASVEPDATFLSGTVTCFVPLFFFFSEGINSFLDTRYLETLELFCTTNDDFGSMGMSAALTSATYELYMLFHDTNDSNAIDDLYFTRKPNLPKSLVASFDTFFEDQVSVLTSATSARLLLRCNKPAYVLHLALVDANSKRALIKTLKINVGGTDLVDMDYRTNYQTYSQDQSFLENGTVSLWFSKEKKRDSDSGLIIFSDAMFPSYLDITFDALPGAYTLHAFEEVRTHFDVSDIGIIKISDGQSELDQLNSSIEAANLLGT